jgi:hypothetical protein
MSCDVHDDVEQPTQETIFWDIYQSFVVGIVERVKGHDDYRERTANALSLALYFERNSRETFAGVLMKY